MKYCIDRIVVEDSTVDIVGWAVGDTVTDTVDITVETKRHKPVEFKLIRQNRYDVTGNLFQTTGDYLFGFKLSFQSEPKTAYRLIFQCKEQKKTVNVNPEKQAGEQNDRFSLGKTLSRLICPQTVIKSIRFIKLYGLKKFCELVIWIINGTDSDYMKWNQKVKPSEEELKRQREEQFAWQPKFSIVVPLFRTPENFLIALIGSVLAQTYGNWELCLAEGSGKEKSTVPILDSYAKKDERIRYCVLESNEGIAGNTNAALEMATGDYIVLADHDDLLTPDALYHCAKAANRSVRPDVIYSDEDKITSDGKQLTEPHFKPDFSPDYLRSNNYICHLFVMSKALLDKVGGFRSEYDGAQDYDLILRCTEEAKEIYHIPRALYHWRISPASTASNAEAKGYAFEAGRKALEAHCARMGMAATVEHTPFPGYYHTIYELKERPLISVIIPTKDHRDDLKQCLESIFTKSSYTNLEFILIENNSVEPETFAYYEELKAAHDNLKVVVWEGEFNYSKINNYGVTFANGEYLLFLNNDIELISEESIGEMLSYCQREDVGVVGARLLYPDDTIQHAGVIVGYGGVAGHTFVGLDYRSVSYGLRASAVQNYSAVTAACMMTKRSVFDEVGGFYDGLAVAFNDVDFCLKVRETGRLVVYTPYATLRHYESKSRGVDDTPEKAMRFQGEIAMFKKRWPEILQNGDPYYNPNLNSRSPGFKLRNLVRKSVQMD